MPRYRDPWDDPEPEDGLGAGASDAATEGAEPDPGEADIRFVAGPAERGRSLLDALSERVPDLSIRALKRLIGRGHVRVNDAATAPMHPLRPGDLVVCPSADRASDFGALPIEPAPLRGLEPLYKDLAVLAVAKPAGVSVLPGRSERRQDFLRGIRHLLDRLAREEAGPGEVPVRPRPRLVHRLDKDTSGVLLVARTRDAYRDLLAQMEQRTIEKCYLAIVSPAPLEDDITIDLALAPLERGGRVAPSERGKPAVTRFHVVERFRRHALVEAHPLTGRTHQVRAHLLAAGSPLAVDPTYGGAEELFLSEIKRDYKRKRSEVERPLLSRLSLHALRITFRSLAAAPGTRVTVEAPLPGDIALALKMLRRHGSP